MSFDFSTLITDRTQADVTRVKQIAEKIKNGTASESELAEFNSAAMKGAYNYTDLNRVTAAMEALKAKMEGYGYAVPGYQRIKVSHPTAGSRLPEGYTELTYIESTGTQYADTGFKPNQDTRVTLDTQITDTAIRHLFGARTTSTTNMFFVACMSATSFRADYGSEQKTFSVGNVLNRTVIDCNKNVVTIGGTSQTYTKATFSPNLNMLLFTDNTGGNVTADTYKAKMKLYSCQIYDNGTLVRDYVPCINPSGEVGLYDLVTKAFFGNSGMGVFIAGTPVVKLPDGYTQVEYLESTGTQYVVTDFVPNQDTKLVMVTMPSTVVNAASSNGFIPYGAGNSSTDGAFECYTWNSNHECNYDGQRGTLSTATANVLVSIYHNKNQFTLSDATGAVMSKTYTYNAFTSPRALALFAANRASPIKGKQKIYLCLLFDNNTLVRFYIPCINAAGEAGLYDLVGGKFYGNAGSGVFVTGPEVYGVDDRVQLLLHGEELADSSGHAREITNYGVTVSGTKGKFGGKSLHFNGNSYLTVPVPVEGDMTIDFWVYITGYDVSDPTIFSYATASGWRGVYTHVYSSTTTWGASTPSTQYNAVQGTPISINTWHHIAAVRSGTITKFYLDGVLDGTLTDNDPTNGVLYLGEALDVPSISKFSGYVDELRISNVARWHGNFTPKESAYSLPAEKNTTNDSAHVEYDPYLWYEVDSPTTEQMTVYLLNVSIIRSVLAVMETTPEVPADMVELMVQEANDIERILLDVYRQLAIMATTFIPCGEALCGGDNL